MYNGNGTTKSCEAQTLTRLLACACVPCTMGMECVTLTHVSCHTFPLRGAGQQMSHQQCSGRRVAQVRQPLPLLYGHSHARTSTKSSKLCRKAAPPRTRDVPASSRHACAPSPGLVEDMCPEPWPRGRRVQGRSVCLTTCSGCAGVFGASQGVCACPSGSQQASFCHADARGAGPCRLRPPRCPVRHRCSLAPWGCLPLNRGDGEPEDHQAPLALVEAPTQQLSALQLATAGAAAARRPPVRTAVSSAAARVSTCLSKNSRVQYDASIDPQFPLYCSVNLAFAGFTDRTAKCWTCCDSETYLSFLHRFPRRR